VVRAARVMHGKLDQVTHDARGVFTGIPSPVTVTRYHSLAIERATLPDCLEVTATTADREIMACAIATTRSRACSSTPKRS